MAIDKKQKGDPAPMGTAAAARRISSYMIKGSVRKAAHLAASDEGSRAWPLLIAPQLPVIAFSYGLVNFFGSQKPGVTPVGSMLRGLISSVEIFALLFLVLRLLTVIIRCGIDSRGVLSLIGTAAFPMTVCMAAAAASCKLLPLMAEPLIMTGALLSAIMVYMGVEYASITRRVRSFAWFSVLLLLLVTVATILAKQMQYHV